LAACGKTLELKVQLKKVFDDVGFNLTWNERSTISLSIDYLHQEVTVLRLFGGKITVWQEPTNSNGNIYLGKWVSLERHKKIKGTERLLPHFVTKMK